MFRTGTTRRTFLGGVATAGAAAALRPKLGMAADSKTLTIRQPQDIGVIDPANTSNLIEITVVYAINNRLITFTPGTWDWQLDAAEHLEVVDDTHIEFRLRPGIMWTGGYGGMTAEDVKFTFERMQDPATQSPYANDVIWLDHVEVTGKYSGALVLKGMSPAIWSTLPWIPASIVCKKAVEDYIERTGQPLYGADPLATSNVYKIKEWVPKQRLVLDVHPGWPGERPDFEEVVMLPIDDDKTAEIAFEAGEVDITQISTSSIPVYQANPPVEASLRVFPNLGLLWLGMNTEHPPFDDQRVRRAVQLGVDVDLILEGALFGLAIRATGTITPGVVGHRGYNLYPNRDVAKAKELLAEAGLADGFKTNITIENTTERMTVAQIIQSNLAEIGIDVEINALDSGLFWIQGLESEGEYWKDLQMFMHDWGWTPDPAMPSQWYVPEQVGIWNWERWNSPEYGELHQTAIMETDPEKRHTMYVRMQDLMEESGAYLFLTPGITGLLVRDGIEPATSPDGQRWFLPFFKHV